MISYLFTDLDIAFFAMMHESLLPEIVFPDPLAYKSETKTKKLQREFYERQTAEGNLSVDGEKITLTDDLAKTLSPVFEGYVAVSHVNTSILRLTEYNRIFYVSEANGVTLIEYGRGRAEANKYRLTWYPDLAAFNADFITAFGLSSVAPYSKKPFKICDESQIIDDIMYAKIRKNKKIEDFARRHEADPEQIKFMLKAIKSKKNMFLINVIRHESIKSGAIMVKLMLAEQFMMRIILSPDGHLISFESFSQEGLINQIINFEGK